MPCVLLRRSVVLFYAVVGAMGGRYSNKVAIIITEGLNKEGKIYDHVELRVQQHTFTRS